MEQPRSPSDLLAWVMAKCEELGATPEAKAFARSGNLLPKKFYDEIYPLAFFAEREFRGRDGVVVHPSLDNDNFDGRIVVGSGPDARTLFVEITFAKDGYDESLRMEVLSREGHVSLTGPVFRSGRRGSPRRNVRVESEAVSHSALVEEYLDLVEKRVRDKAVARYGRTHVLVVAVDDYLPLQDPADAERLHDFASSLLPKLQLDFGRVVFVGVAGKIFLSYDIAPHPYADAGL